MSHLPVVGLRSLRLPLAVACFTAGCGDAVDPVTHSLTVQMSDSALSRPSQASIVLDPAPMKGAARLEVSATVSYPAGVTVSIRAIVPTPPPPGQPGRVVRVSWQGCDRLDGEVLCVVANLQADRKVGAEFTSLEVFSPGPGL